MPRSVHAYTCFSCGKSEMCGDCIPLYCDDCDRIIRACHNGKLPDFFGLKKMDLEPHPDCPCSGCKSFRNNQSIIAKLKAAGIDIPGYLKEETQE